MKVSRKKIFSNKILRKKNQSFDLEKSAFKRSKHRFSAFFKTPLFFLKKNRTEFSSFLKFLKVEKTTFFVKFLKTDFFETKILADFSNKTKSEKPPLDAGNSVFSLFSNLVFFFLKKFFEKISAGAEKVKVWSGYALG